MSTLTQSAPSTPVPSYEGAEKCLLSPTQQSFVDAWERAKAERLVAYRIDVNHYQVPSGSDSSVEYAVEFTGPEWHRWTCTCPAGQHDRVCKHKAIALRCRKDHTGAVRGTRKSAPVVAQAEAVVTHTLRERAKAETAANIAAGLDPLAGLF